jgi:hypothetical protein
MNQNPRNCRNNCPFENTADCPAIVFEQIEHMHGFSTLMITVTPIIGCTAYPENPEQEPAAETHSVEQHLTKQPVSVKKKR